MSGKPVCIWAIRLKTNWPLYYFIIPLSTADKETINLPWEGWNKEKKHNGQVAYLLYCPRLAYLNQHPRMTSAQTVKTLL